MIVDPEKTKIISPNHSIEIGQSGWDPEETSIRLRYDGETGRFSPHGSSELPIYYLQALIESAAQYDLLSTKECASIIQSLADSIKRQCPAKPVDAEVRQMLDELKLMFGDVEDVPPAFRKGHTPDKD